MFVDHARGWLRSLTSDSYGASVVVVSAAEGGKSDAFLLN